MVAGSAVQETSHTYTWFFLFYRFVVGVLFAELMVGVLIATFGEVSQLDGCVIGEVLHEFSNELEVLSHEEQVVFVKGLGIPAQFCLDTENSEPDIENPSPSKEELMNVFEVQRTMPFDSEGHPASVLTSSSDKHCC